MVCVFAPAADDRSGLEAGSLAGVPDPQFPHILVQRLARLLRADLVAVAQCSGAGQMRVLAGCFDGLTLEDMDYANHFTPCGEVLRTARPLLLAGGLQQRFAKDRMLLTEDIQSYAGLPLLLPDGGIAGVLHAAWRQTAGEALVARARAAMQPYTARLAGVVRGQRQAGIIAALARGPGDVGPEAALRWLGVQLQAASGARGVLIASAMENRGTGARSRPLAQSKVVACAMDGAVRLDAEGGAVPQELAAGNASGTWLTDPLLRVALRAGAAAELVNPPLAWARSHPLPDRHGRIAACCVLLDAGPLAPLEPELFGIFAARTRQELRRMEARRLRRQRRRLHQQAEKAASLTRLAASIAQDFGAGLAALQSQAELLQAQLGHRADCTADGADVQRLVRGIRGCTGLLHPLQDCADTSARAAGGRCDLNAAVTAAAQLSGTPVARDLSGTPLLVPGDEVQLRALVLALLEHAAEARQGLQGSTVALTTRLDDPGVAERHAMLYGRRLPPGPCASLEVRVTGGGMDSPGLNRIFDPCSFTHSGMQELRLAAVLGILRRHGGAVLAGSAPGQESCFRLCLPLTGAAAGTGAGALRASARAAEDAAARPILVVDDEDTVCRAVAGLLRLKGRAVMRADSHEAALAVLRDSAPLGAAIIDMNLPGACGWETLAALTARQPGLPCVMMSGFPVSAAAAGYPELSGIEVLQKPFGKDALYRAVLG